MKLSALFWPPWRRGGSAYLKDDEYAAMLDALNNATKQDVFSDDTYDIAEKSLRFVIDLTGYEDNKVARLLTVAAFLSAIIGAVFTRFSTSYSWSGGPTEVRITYVVFFAYAAFVSLAAAVLIGSIRPTFNLKWTNESGKAPRSLFFYREILGVSPKLWAEEFIENKSLKQKATANFIGETYFVAEKIAKKLWWVQRGIVVLMLAMVLLVVFFVLTGFTYARISPTPIPPTHFIILSPVRVITNSTPTVFRASTQNITPGPKAKSKGP